MSYEKFGFRACWNLNNRKMLYLMLPNAWNRTRIYTKLPKWRTGYVFSNFISKGLNFSQKNRREMTISWLSGSPVVPIYDNGVMGNRDILRINMCHNFLWCWPEVKPPPWRRLLLSITTLINIVKQNISDFWLPLARHNAGNNFIEFLVLDNMGTSVGIIHQ